VLTAITLYLADDPISLVISRVADFSTYPVLSRMNGPLFCVESEKRYKAWPGAGIQFNSVTCLIDLSGMGGRSIASPSFDRNPVIATYLCHLASVNEGYVE
jgi:hypothetical protein